MVRSYALRSENRQLYGETVSAGSLSALTAETHSLDDDDSALVPSHTTIEREDDRWRLQLAGHPRSPCRPSFWLRSHICTAEVLESIDYEAERSGSIILCVHLFPDAEGEDPDLLMSTL